jgi:hypothetical protein
MMKDRNAGSTFEDLEVYQIARNSRKTMHGLARRLPDIEKFGLASQIRRPALSLTNNIARGSLEELIDDLKACEDQQYLPEKEITVPKHKGWRIRRLIDGYIRYLRQQKNLERDASSAQETSSIYDSPFNEPR